MTYKDKMYERFECDKARDMMRDFCPNDFFKMSDDKCPQNTCMNCWSRQYKGEEIR